MNKAVGYEYLRERLALSAFPQIPPAIIKPVSRIDRNEAFLAVPAAAAPAADDLLGHVLFALKHEGTNLQVLAEAIPRIGADAIRAEFAARPNGRYIRITAYLWEAFTGESLGDVAPAGGPFAELFDPKYYVTAPGQRSSRWRVMFNGLGSLRTCATVRRTPAIETGQRADILGKAKAFVEHTDRLILDRAIAWAYLGETQASFDIERESPSPDKAWAFAELLRHAHEPRPLTEDYLVELQNATISNPFDRAVVFRHEQNWLGNGGPGAMGVTYVPPPPDLARDMMDDLMAFANGPARQIDPLVAAACISFGFVFIHPFMDGNGRLSRFLFHHALCQSGQLTDGLILPVSIAMAKHEREYLSALHTFSLQARRAWSVQMIDTDQYAFEFRGATSLYRYWDATQCVEFGMKMAQTALDIHLHDQVSFTRRYDRVTREIDAQYDIRGSILNALIVSCIQQGGRLSNRRRDQFAHAVPPGAFEAIERAVRDALCEPSDADPDDEQPTATPSGGVRGIR